MNRESHIAEICYRMIKNVKRPIPDECSICKEVNPENKKQHCIKCWK
jgi:hypothetical protein